MIEFTRIAPHNREAEDAVIASCILGGNETLVEVKPLISGDDFFTEVNRWCWEAMVALDDRNQKIDQITLSQELASRDKLELLGGGSYLARLIANCPSAVFVQEYAGIMRRLSTCRQLMVAGTKIVQLGMEETNEPDKKIIEAEKLLFDLREQRAKSALLTSKELGLIAFDRYCALSAEGDTTAIPYGFPALDKETGGAHLGDFIIVGGRPRIGKSSLLQSMARSMDDIYQKKVLLVSVEMSTEQVIDREASAFTSLPVAVIASGKYDEPVEKKLLEFAGAFSERNLNLLPRSGRITTSDIAAVVQRLKHEVGLDVVMVDYIGILADEYGHNTNERISYISRKLKGIASEYNVAVIAASQLSREVEKSRTNKRPMLPDLRDSGSLEQDSDVVMLLYRDDLYYTADEWYNEVSQQAPYPKGIAEVILAKQRQRESNVTVKLRWSGATMQYRNLE